MMQLCYNWVIGCSQTSAPRCDKSLCLDVADLQEKTGAACPTVKDMVVNSLNSTLQRQTI